MPVQEKIYRGGGDAPQLTPLPSTRPQAELATGVGEGMSEVGATLHKAKVRELERQFQSDYSSALVGLAKFTQDADVHRNEVREEALLDGAGHAEKVKGDLNSMAENFLGSIANPKIRERLTPQVESVIGRVYGDEDAWQRGRRSVAITANAADAANGFAMALQDNPDEGALETAIAAGEEYVKSTLPGDAATADKVARFWKERVATGYVRGLTEKDPSAAIAVLQSGKLDPLLNDPDAKQALLNQAQTALRVQGADARRVANEQAAQVRSNAQIAFQNDAAGIDIPDKGWDELIAGAAAIGDAPLVNRLQLTKLDQGTKRATKGWGQSDFDREILELEGEKARTPAEDAYLSSLKRIRPSAAATFDNNQWEAAAAGGNPPPDPDFSIFGAPSAGQVSAQIAWAEGRARAHPDLKTVPYLSKSDVEQVRKLVAEGGAAAFDVVAKLRDTFGPDRAATIARQIEPANEHLPLMARMIPQVAQDYRRGIGAIARNPKLFPTSFTDAPDQSPAQIFAAYGDAIPPDQRDAVFAAAKMIAAGMADRENLGDLSDSPELFGKIFRMALDRAAGQRGAPGARTGGFGKWNGKAVWLPSDMAGSDFARRISRAGPKQWIAAGGGQPLYRAPDNKHRPVPEDWYQRFRNAPLITVAPGVYIPLGRDGQPLADANGSAWRFDIRKLP